MQDLIKPEPAAKARGTETGFDFSGTVVAPGHRATVDLPLSLLSDHTPITLTAEIVHGRRPGPVLLINGAVHGDEVNGVEIIRRVLRQAALRRLSGTLIAVPIVNVYGFLTNTRYLPDRRDLNRSFPGSSHGSLASRLAHMFLTNIVKRADYGIDLHTAAIHRENFPQIRGDLSHPAVRDLAMAFGVPVVLNAALRQGSLRKAAIESDVPFLVYEAGEALRFDEVAIRAGVRGVLRVMSHLGMIAPRRWREAKTEPTIARRSTWIRAPEGGIFRAGIKLGERVAADEVLGIIADPFGEMEFPIHCSCDGVLIGRNNLPNVNQGDGLFHVARVDDPDAAAEAIEIFQDDTEVGA
ncbi:MAG: succinylglutamate desuccinylase/aspartoacylase family protein [Alphaproteobacteria bacterium]|nr:succinylglutamate desuccinylase/aspartoacylase family protein [Alphaproteobacteria bacterium]